MKAALIFNWLTQVNIYCLEFISHYIKEILTSDIDVEKSCFFEKFFFIDI